jgi:hypothetical protein
MKHVHILIKRYTKDKDENVITLLLNLIKDFPKRFFFILEVYIPLKILILPAEVDMVVNAIFLFALTIQIIRLVTKILTFSLAGLFKKKKMKEDKTARKTIHMMVSVTVWVI